MRGNAVPASDGAGSPRGKHAGQRYVAFLRAINVGGNNLVKMEDLRKSFVRLGFTDVETFIASGNVVFTSPVTDTAKLEQQIEARLQKDLGFAIATFVRTTEEVIAIAQYQAFHPERAAAATALNVGFLAQPMAAESRAALQKLATEIDLFHVSEREWYWLSHRTQGNSMISNAAIEKALNVKSTLRGINTILRLAGRLQAVPAPKGAARAAAPVKQRVTTVRKPRRQQR